MQKGQKVKHSKFGLGIVKHVLFEGKKRECYIIEFEKSNIQLNNCFGLAKDKHGYICCSLEVETYDE